MASELIAFHQPEHAVSEQYRALAGQLLPKTVDGKGRTLLFASLAPGAGTTTALLNLAISTCARYDRQTIVVDANLRRPALAQRLGLPAAAGLQEVLAGSVALERALQTTAQTNLHALAAGSSAGKAATFPTEAIHWVVAWLRERFELIFIDGPVCSEADLAVLLPVADAFYLVLDHADASQPKVRLATKTISQLGGRVAGYIVTQG
jgi:Mrp family chromosome partitioning ATPase